MTRGRKQSAMSLLKARATKDCVVDGLFLVEDCFRYVNLVKREDWVEIFLFFFRISKINESRIFHWRGRNLFLGIL